MNEIVYRNIALLVELTKLFLVICGILEYRIKRKPIVAISVVFAMCISSALAGVIVISAYSFFSGVACISIVILSISGRKRILYCALSYTAICVVDLMVGNIAFFLMDISRTQYYESKYLMIGMNSISILIYLVVLVVKFICNKRIANIIQNTKTLQLVLFFVGLMASLLYITPLAFDKSVISSTDFRQSFFSFALVIGGLVFIGIYIALVISNNSRDYFKAIIATKEEIARQKEEYDIILSSKNDEIRKFKHDIKDKMFCLHLLLDDKRYDELEVYFNQIDAVISDFEIDIQTGNKLLNAIANSLFKEYKSTDVVVNWKGQLPEKINMSDLDLSTIFSNLLRNAFEATMLCEQDKSIDVTIKILDISIFVTVKNTFSGNLTIVDGVIATNKRDKKNHGYGCLNIKDCVESYNGSVKYSNNDKYFIAEVALPFVLYPE